MVRHLGALSLLFLWFTHSPRPSVEQARWIGLSALGNALGYPLLLGWALRYVSASHAAVITALLPLATAAAAAWLLHQRARLGFWLFALLGSALVVIYSALRAHGLGSVPTGWVWADALLVGAVLAASLGYVAGAQVTPALGAERVISWVCVMALPLALPMAWWTWPTQGIALSSWLALGGALRVSQLQLFQPFIAMLAAVPLLGESLDVWTLGFALAVVAAVVAGRRSV
jgi:drug/metabolite transporter (DMT)-like permease